MAGPYCDAVCFYQWCWLLPIKCGHNTPPTAMLGLLSPTTHLREAFKVQFMGEAAPVSLINGLSIKTLCTSNETGCTGGWDLSVWGGGYQGMPARPHPLWDRSSACCRRGSRGLALWHSNATLPTGRPSSGILKYLSSFSNYKFYMKNLCTLKIFYVHFVLTLEHCIMSDSFNLSVLAYPKV